MRSLHRIPCLLGLIAILTGALALPLTVTAAQQATCADYTSASAAQFALDINPGLAASLDPDGNGVACDEAGDTGASSSDTDLQLPAGQTPTAAAPPAQATADVVDQQPTDTTQTTTTTTPPQPGVLDGRLGSMQQTFETVHGVPVEEIPSDTNPAVISRAYTPPATVADLFVVYFNNQVAIVLLTAQAPWSSADAAGIIDDYLPQDVTTLPQPEALGDGSLLMPITSQQLATGVTADMMTQAGLPGAPGDLYIRLSVDSANLITEVEMGIGNGDNVREDINSGGTQTTPVSVPTTPTPAAATTTTTDANAFLQQARAEVDQYRAEMVELRAILAAGTFTEAETTRLTEIIVSWMAIDTTPLNAPPEHPAIADLLQTIHADLSAVGVMLLGIMGGDTTDVQAASDTLARIDTNLNALDQQLIALGF